MKTKALYLEDGKFEEITGFEVLRREKNEPGQWRRRPYYSTEADPADRRLMHHRWDVKKNRAYFAYNMGPQPDRRSESEGESLTHELYARAICNLKSTTLRLGDPPASFEIQIKSAEREKTFELDGTTFRVDVFLQFESSEPLAQKWKNQCAIEVCHTHPTHGEKLEALAVLGIPVLEVKVSEKFLFPQSRSESTPEEEATHQRYLETRLSEFIWAKVLVDPQTTRELIEENKALLSELETANALIAKKKAEEAFYIQEFKGLLSQLDTTKKELQKAFSADTRREETIAQFQEITSEVARLQGKLVVVMEESRQHKNDIEAFQSLSLPQMIWRRVRRIPPFHWKSDDR